MNVRKYLEDNHVAFQTLVHPRSYDAQHLAQTTHVTGKHVAKAVLLHVNHGFGDAVAIVPATSRVDFAKVSAMLGGAAVKLATEQEVAVRCPDCEMGVLSPFGSQYHMRTLVDESLVGDEIVFESNRHDEAIRMKFADFRKLESPLVGLIAVTPVE